MAAAVVTGGTTLIYIWLIANQSTSRPARVAAVLALFLLALACTVGAVLLRTPEGRHLAAAGGTGMLISMGYLALFSVGLLLLVAAGLLILAIGAGRAERRRSSKARVILAFAVGAALPWLLVLTA
jgi:hypothetical protein